MAKIRCQGRFGEVRSVNGSIVAGIGGIVSWRKQNREPGELHDFAYRLDADQTWEGDCVKLAHGAGRRHGPSLSESGGGQVLIVDGALSETERERLLIQWRERGPSCLEDLGVEFSIAVWDLDEEVLWLARDACGTRSLFWAEGDRKVAFGTLVPALLGLPWVSRDLAVEHLSEYLAFRYVHAPRTLLNRMYSVPPGHVVRIDASGHRIERWWVAPWAPVPGPELDSERVWDGLDSALRRAVERRNNNEECVGVLLSGGLCSSAVLFHSQRNGMVPPSFTVTLEGTKADESAFARRVARTFDSDHHLVTVKGTQLVAGVDACTAELGFPLPSVVGAVQRRLYEQVEGEVDILLSGEGGDEVLGGRDLGRVLATTRVESTLRRAPRAAKWIGHKLAGAVGRELIRGSRGLDMGFGGSSVFSPEDRVSLLRDPALVRPGIRRNSLEPLYAEVNADAVNQVLHVWQRGLLCEDVLARSQQASANLGVEVRFPFLDTQFLSQCAALPGSMKVRPGRLAESKIPLRTAMESRLPRGVVRRAKRAFPTPLNAWLREEGRGFLWERCEGLCEDPEGHFVPARVRQLVRSHLAGQDHGLQLWTLCLFSGWRDALRS
ncbi:MAG: asparagine synthetase B [Myxococcota bacterium]|jgi:asparagine synthase (glutamine-hydrolysing)|nr:asparagine synthetase B [Myxococcota bacterium]